jgi:thiamine kinase-like enzyme
MGEPGGSAIWHVYEDLGTSLLDAHRESEAHLKQAAEALADVHARGLGHWLLGEIRHFGRDLGTHFLRGSILDAARSLERVSQDRVPSSDLETGVLSKVSDAVEAARETLAVHVAILQANGGPETILHGDVNLDNIAYPDGSGDHGVRFMDWDHAGVGPPTYDLSCFLSGVPPHLHTPVLAAYRNAFRPLEEMVPSDPEILREVFHALELGRLCNRVVWATSGILDGDADWGWEELALIGDWFAKQPVVPARP